MTYAAFQLYALLSQTVAFGLMVLVTILACLLALVYDTQWLAVLGLIGGFLTPLILSTGQSAQVVLMSYMVLLNGGILSIAAWKRWKILNTLGFLCTWVLFTGWFVDSYTVAIFWRTLVFLHLFFLIYAFVPFLYYFVHASGAQLTGALLTSLNTLVTFAYAYGMVRTYAVTPGCEPRSAGLREPVLWYGQLPVSAAPGEPGTVYFAAGQGAAVSHPRRTDVILRALDYAVLVRAGWRHSVGWPASAQPLAVLRGPGAPPARGGEIGVLRLWGSVCVPPGDICLCQRLC